MFGGVAPQVCAFPLFSLFISSLFARVLAQRFEINPSHKLILALNDARKSNPDTAKLGAAGESLLCKRYLFCCISLSLLTQVFDNALLAAGLLDEP